MSSLAVVLLSVSFLHICPGLVLPEWVVGLELCICSLVLVYVLGGKVPVVGMLSGDTCMGSQPSLALTVASRLLPCCYAVDHRGPKASQLMTCR